MASIKLLVLLIVLCAVIECSGRPRKNKKSRGSAVQSLGGSGVNTAKKGAGQAAAQGKKTSKVRKDKKSKKGKKEKTSKKVKKPQKATKKPKKTNEKKKTSKKDKKQKKGKKNKANKKNKASKDCKKTVTETSLNDSLQRSLKTFKEEQAQQPAKSQEEEDPCVKAHNIVRSYHKDTPNLTYSASLAADAQAWANYLAKKDKFEHAQLDGQGENLYMSAGGSPTYASAVYGWYEESWHPIDNTGNQAKHPKDYDYSSNDFDFGTGHFTQVVWKDTTKVGCGIAKIERNGWMYTYIVSRYAPPGNYAGQFTNNVMDTKDPAVIDTLKVEGKSLLE